MLFKTMNGAARWGGPVHRWDDLNQYTSTLVFAGQLFQIHLASSTLRRTQPWEARLPRWLTELWVTLPPF